jgi:NADPH:quinone reductase-like Zn-dependent oxidoreductase
MSNQSPESHKSTMQAVVLHKFGGPKVLQLETVVRPQPARGQLLIRVQAASVNPVDHKIRTGKYKMFRPELPAIIGRDIAGTICGAGPGTHGPFKVGDPVFGMLDYPRGAYCQYTIATARDLALRPENVPVQSAAALGVAGLTAWQGLFDHGQLKRGERVLIHGAAGGVGHLAVQFAKWYGASVIATCGPQDVAWIKRLGADKVIDYENQLFENETGNVDLVYDLIAGETLDRSWQVLKEKGGRIVSTLDHSGAQRQARLHHARWTHMVVTAKSEQLTQIARLVAADKVILHVAKIFPLAQIQAAHRLVEDGHFRGKVLLKVQS